MSAQAFLKLVFLAGVLAVGPWTTAAMAASRTAAAKAPAAADELVIDAGASMSVTSSGSVFVDATATAPLSGTARTDGVRVRVEALAGRYDADAGGGRTVATTRAELSGLVGYEWVWSQARLTAFAGLTVGDTSVPSGAATGQDTGVHAGGKVAAQFYMRPSPRSMVSAYASYSTDRNGYYLHARAGYAAFGSYYVGPEAALLGDDTYRQWRLGAHVTGLRLGSLEMSLAGGFMQDQSQKAGGYATVDVRSGF